MYMLKKCDIILTFLELVTLSGYWKDYGAMDRIANLWQVCLGFARIDMLAHLGLPIDW